MFPPRLGEICLGDACSEAFQGVFDGSLTRIDKRKIDAGQLCTDLPDHPVNLPKNPAKSISCVAIMQGFA
jgi:hypothetical protein